MARTRPPEATKPAPRCPDPRKPGNPATARGLGRESAITCGGCPATWTATGAAHCACCHQTFSTWRLFDAHRHARGEHGGCLDPSAIVNGVTGERVMFLREGMWRGPELTDEQKARMRGRVSEPTTTRPRRSV